MLPLTEKAAGAQGASKPGSFSSGVNGRAGTGTRFPNPEFGALDLRNSGWGARGWCGHSEDFRAGLPVPPNGTGD